MIRPNLKARRRVGFTLVELLLVIVIIGVLIALLVPVIIAAVRRANDARVSAEIQRLAQALTEFKNRYGEFPPSRVVLSESGIYSLAGGATPVASDYNTALSAVSTWYGTVSPLEFGTPDISIGDLAQRSLRALRKYFPRAYLGPTPITATLTYFPDYNGNGVLDAGFIYLAGDECLTFFLGGIPTTTATSGATLSFGMSGFAKDPQFPFRNGNASVASANTIQSTTNRYPAFYEFSPDRLIDDDGDGIPGYIDSLGTGGDAKFYAYFSTSGANGYDPNDCNGAEQDDQGNAVGTYFRVNFPAYGGANTVLSPAPNPYTASLPTPVNGSSGFDPNLPASYINPNSFQIISCGADRLFGAGGQYSSGAEPKLIDYTSIPGASFGVPTGLRLRENDNLSSFTQGRLD